MSVQDRVVARARTTWRPSFQRIEKLFVALHPRDVSGRKVEHLVGPDDRLLAFVGPDTHPPMEDNAAVMELARVGADLRPRVCLPAPALLQDVVADHRSGQATWFVAPSSWATTASGSLR